MMASGYVTCKCRDCFDIAVADDERKGAFCDDCQDAGCPDYQGQPGMSQECQREDRDEHREDCGCPECHPEVNIEERLDEAWEAYQEAKGDARRKGED